MSKKASNSFCKGKGSIGHNNRDFITPNVDQSRTHLNVTYVRQPLEDAYEHLFGEAVRAYNDKQKRADRKINDYLDKIRTSKNGEKIFYESLVQVGTMHNCHVTSENGKEAAQILDEYMKGFQLRNPNLYVFNAVMHLDEQTPHLHIDWIPVAEGYKSGLAIRNSLDKALKQQGIDGSGGKLGNSTQHWQDREKMELASIMERFGWEYEAYSGEGRGNLTVDQYRAMAREIEHQADRLPDQIESRPVPLSKDKVIVDKSELAELEEKAKLSHVHQQVTSDLKEQMEQRNSDHEEYVELQRTIIEQTVAGAKKLKKEAQEEKIEAGELKATAVNMYQSQIDLNERHHKIKVAAKKVLEENNALKDENAALKVEIAALKAGIDEKVQKAVDEAKMPLQAKIDQLQERVEKLIQSLNTAYETIKSICKAVCTLKYDKTDGYGVRDLSSKQERLIEAIANVGEKQAEKAGYKDVAETIRTKYGIDETVKKEVKALTPKEQVQDR